MPHPKINISYIAPEAMREPRGIALLARGFNAILDRMGGVTGSSHPLRNYTVATLPDASANKWGLIIVTDETGGATPAFSDGVNWRRTSDRAICS